MYKLGIIEEIPCSKNMFDSLECWLAKQRVEEVPGYTVSVWHINEYHVPDFELPGYLPVLENRALPVWYIYAFNRDALIVVLKGKSFEISRVKDDSWNEMIEHGESVGVERRYLENISMRVWIPVGFCLSSVQ